MELTKEQLKAIDTIQFHLNDIKTGLEMGQFLPEDVEAIREACDVLTPRHSCSSCKHENTQGDVMPCVDCRGFLSDYALWEPKEPSDAGQTFRDDIPDNRSSGQW